MVYESSDWSFFPNVCWGCLETFCSSMWQLTQFWKEDSPCKGDSLFTRNFNQVNRFKARQNAGDFHKRTQFNKIHVDFLSIFSVMVSDGIILDSIYKKRKKKKNVSMLQCYCFFCSYLTDTRQKLMADITVAHKMSKKSGEEHLFNYLVKTGAIMRTEDCL